MNGQSDKKEIRVWDKPTRLFHWSLVTMVAIGWITSEAEGALFWTHLMSGYGILLLVFFRLVWGVLGGRHARFSDFVTGRDAIRSHIRGILTLRPPRHIGHNPLGGWMILALLAGLGLVVATGLFSSHHDDHGPYAALVSSGMAEALSEVHEALTSILLFLIVGHVLGVLLDSLLGQENLVRAMWTGRKKIPADAQQDDAPQSSVGRFVMALVVAGLGLAAVILGAPVV